MCAIGKGKPSPNDYIEAVHNAVQLFVTCLIDSLFPEVGEAVVEVLARAGIAARFPPDQTCCGQPPFNAGFHAPARRLAKHTLRSLEGTEEAVVVPSGSCAAMIRHGYPELFAADPVWEPRARALADRTFELSQYLVDQAGYRPPLQAPAGRVVYHPSCHLQRGLGVDRQPRALLEAAAGGPVDGLEPECCGFGGLFSIELEEVSAAMMGRKLAEIEAVGPTAVVGCDVSCLMHLEGGLRRRGSAARCSHLAQVLCGREVGLR
jgi:L-lactate dehydrogenase complex protein LldE